MTTSNWVLPFIVFAQFCCTCMWFAGNAVMDDLVLHFQLADQVLGHLTTAVQLGFITGTLLFAVLTLSDRYSPSRVFMVCACIGALFNGATIWDGNGLFSLLSLRFLTGFFLAGIYPVGMKIAADYFDKGLGKSLGYLVGALVVGTAFPHLLKGLTTDWPWKLVLMGTSFLSITGGVVMLIGVPDGPFRKPSQRLDLSAFFRVFENRDFRSAAFGYFGHMWELYAFWAFVPVILTSYESLHPRVTLNVPVLSFSIIAIGGLACVLGGYGSLKFGVKRTASLALLLSGLCCVFSPTLFMIESIPLVLAYLLFWGMVVIADSPLFSTLVAQNAPAESKGTALTIVNCIGFSITIVSIQLLSLAYKYLPLSYLYLLLAIGPIIGLLALMSKKSKFE